MSRHHEVVISLYKKGYPVEHIADSLGRSVRSVSCIIDYLRYNGKLVEERVVEEEKGSAVHNTSEIVRSLSEKKEKLLKKKVSLKREMSFLEGLDNLIKTYGDCSDLVDIKILKS